MDAYTSLLIVKTTLISGLALWCTIAVLNNIMDPKTNIGLVAAMMRMILIKQDQETPGGKALLWRAVDSNWAPVASVAVAIVLQLISAVILWYAGALLFQLMIGGGGSVELTEATTIANLGLSSMLLTWFFFLCGGLWFAYWIKMPQVQQVHIMLVLISLLSLVVVNM